MPEFAVGGAVSASKRLLVLLFVLCIAACDFGGSDRSGGGGGSGGGSSSSGGSSSGGVTEVKRGVFARGLFFGLRYETETQSGFTDIDGVFLYREGETITFSLGSIQLGSAPADTYLNPFDLLGSSAPVTERHLRGLLENRRQVNNLDRVANMTLFLMTLDEDRNPDNGVQLVGWDERLVDVSIDFDVDLYLFPFLEGPETLRALRTRYGVDFEVPESLPLVILYERLRIEVPAHLPERKTRDRGNNGTIETEYLVAYNDFGLPIELRRFPSFSTGQFWDLFARYEYDDWGREEFLQQDRDTNDDSVVDKFIRRRNFYNNSGLLSERLEERGEAGVSYRQKIEYFYDGGGNRTGYVLERDQNADGEADYLQTADYFYDDIGLITEREIETDTDADGRTDQRFRSRYFYTDTGQLERKFKRFDTDNDTADGVTDATIEIDYKYNDEGRLVRVDYVKETDIGGDTEYRFLWRYKYNDRGLLARQVREVDRNITGVFDTRQVLDYRYNAADELATLIVRFDTDNNGVVDFEDTTDFYYNDIGQLERRESVRRNTRGTVELEYVEFYVFGDDGEPLSRTIHYEGTLSDIDDRRSPIYGNHRYRYYDLYRAGLYDQHYYFHHYYWPQSFTGVERWRWQYRTLDDGLRFLIEYYRYTRRYRSLHYPCGTTVADPGVMCIGPERER
ncbi:RHS repeat domain-containing protein [Microbulbifer celer]|uniref:EF-hand domain-containing protein n=1 Tax=Microbulbifer celer TaxID=435905 RepID=A0ABW3UF27_9GAMM|nr:hypothetical protein [Microbulbifer celer]UFN56383.1 hypothetical protein LPW13_12480 [Microbulbifer celer]